MAAPDNRQVNNKESFVALMDLARTAWAAGDFEKVELLQKQLVVERKSLQAGLEEKKEQIHQSSVQK